MAGKKKNTHTVELSKTAFALLIILSAAGLYLIYTLSKDSVTSASAKPVVAEGDVVAINYVARLENNTVFDTSYEDVAVSSGIFESERTYKPVTFTVGAGEIIEGVDVGVVGMREGESKILVIPPNLAFGEYNPQFLRPTPKVYPVNRVSELPLETFRASVAQEPVPGETIVDQNIPWPMLVLSVSQDTISFMYSPTVDSVFQSMMGLAKVVNVTDDQIWILEIPINNTSIMTDIGPARALDYNESTILLDYNHPLAGKTLTYEVVLGGVLKKP
ncbi:MAG: FKBP-type peptidyl-prolyl cis-trans isomerase [Candidatus Altiarchaeota archaeon]